MGRGVLSPQCMYSQSLARSMLTVFLYFYMEFHANRLPNVPNCPIQIVSHMCTSLLYTVHNLDLETNTDRGKTPLEHLESGVGMGDT